MPRQLDATDEIQITWRRYEPERSTEMVGSTSIKELLIPQNQRLTMKIGLVADNITNEILDELASRAKQQLQKTYQGGTVAVLSSAA